VFNNLNPLPADAVTLTGNVTTISPWPTGINFAEVGNAVIGQNGLEKGPLFNQDGIFAISDLNNDDKAVLVAKTAPDGGINITIPKGDYMIAWFDITQVYILQFKTFSIPNDQTEPFELGKLLLTGWYTEVDGFFFNDANENGIRDQDEEGLSNGPFPLLHLRDGTQIDRGFQFEVPFSDPKRKGYYSFRQAYPLASWLTLHAFHPLWELTGYTYKTEQQKTYTTVNATSGEYNIAIFGTPGVNTRLDVGFRAKSNKVTGSIFGSVNYDTTRTNQDAHQAVVENHEPGVPGITVSLYSLDISSNSNGRCDRQCEINATAGFGYICEDEGNIHHGHNLTCTRFWVGGEGESKPHPVVMWTSLDSSNGGILVEPGQLVFDFANKTYPRTLQDRTETAQFVPPINCNITDSEGTVLKYGVGQSVLPDPTAAGVPCIETPLLRNQVGGFSKVDGSFQFDDLAPGYYAIQIEIPKDKRGTGTKPTYKVRTENDINSYESDKFENPTCLVTECPVCPSSDPNCPMPESSTKPVAPNLQNVRMPCAGKVFTVDANADINPTFYKNGGSYADQEVVHYCDIKIVLVEAGVNSRATFHLFTDVPIPSRWKGVVLNDLIPQGNPKATLFTELMGVPGMPVGIRDYKGTKLTDVQTDVSTLVFWLLLRTAYVIIISVPPVLLTNR
jgi:hypothetical protein